MIPQDFIQSLLNRVDIVDVIDRRVPLKKAGANYQACCPFHNEKSPSFTVSQTKQFYHCFGCGAHGTAIGFMMEYAGLNYVDAIKALADQVGMQVPESAAVNPVRAQQAASLLEVMQAAEQYYRQQLKIAPDAVAYLKKRGLTGEIAARFGLGYAPDGWQNLQAVFTNYADASLHEAGLVVVNDAGQRYDRFRERIMFPIINQKGDVIGFGGRILDKGEPKYLNSPETPLFQKGSELYGLFQARRAIRDAGKVIVVEGYMDVVALAQHGVGYAVATLGTATTAIHIQKLLRHTEVLVFCFDGDAAGQRAAWRALEHSLPMLTDSSRFGFLFLPDGHDPDSYIREFSQAGFEQLLTQAVMPLSAYLFKQIAQQHDLTTDEGRSAFLKALQPLIAQVQAPNLALMMRKRAAELAQIDMADLATIWQIKSYRKASIGTARAPRPAPMSVSRQLLRIGLFQPALLLQLPAELLNLADAATQTLRALVEIMHHHPQLSTTSLMEQAKHLPQADMLKQCAAEMMDWAADVDVMPDFDNALAQLQASYRQQRLQVLAQKSLRDLTVAEKQELLQLR
ncbi:MAG: DNA primase [Sulfuriferula sp.]|nr:DNA primase [Sulfuriferula sp.]